MERRTASAKAGGGKFRRGREVACARLGRWRKGALAWRLDRGIRILVGRGARDAPGAKGDFSAKRVEGRRRSIRRVRRLLSTDLGR